jgi:hypothetical protein
MLIVALVLAVVGLAALVTAIVTSNELVAWVCIAASVIGVILLIVDAIRERQRSRAAVAGAAGAAAAAATPEGTDPVDETYENFDEEYPGDAGPAPAEVQYVTSDPVDSAAEDGHEAPHDAAHETVHDAAHETGDGAAKDS